MKRFIVPVLIVSCLIAAAVAGAEQAKKPAKAMATRYLVMVPHTAEECLAALDDFETAKSLGQFDFGCEAGDHSGYSIVTAKSVEEALASVPEKARANAKAVKLHKFSAAELKSFHEQMKH